MCFEELKSWTLVKYPTNLRTKLLCVSIGGSVVECSPATRAARVRFPADATFLWVAGLTFPLTQTYVTRTLREPQRQRHFISTPYQFSRKMLSPRRGIEPRSPA